MGLIGAELINYLQRYYNEHTNVTKDHMKADVVRAMVNELEFSQQGSLFFAPQDDYACRFSFASTGGFSNTVLGLSKLLPFDSKIPVISCCLRPTSYDLLLANTTFLKKISHSSQDLSLDKIRGSFNGTDIMRKYEGIPNTPENFGRLFRLHLEIKPAYNLSRLVAETNLIEGKKKPFVIDARMQEKIWESVRGSLHDQASLGVDFIRRDLNQRVKDQYDEILALAEAERDNVNLRGNAIEQLLTRQLNSHSMEDETFILKNGKRVLVEIKTSLTDRQSSPAFYNVDRLLADLADGNTLFYTYVLFIDLDRSTVWTELVNSFDKRLLQTMTVQNHWSARNSRGTTQVQSGFYRALTQYPQPILDKDAAREFLERLWV